MVGAGSGATVSLITDVNMVQLMERPFAAIDSNSPGSKRIDLPNHALSGDWCSAEHVTKTSARICTPWSGCRDVDIRKDLHAGVVLYDGVAMFQEIREHIAKESNVSYDRIFASVIVIVVVSLGAKLAQAEGRV